MLAFSEGESLSPSQLPPSPHFPHNKFPFTGIFTLDEFALETEIPSLGSSQLMASLMVVWGLEKSPSPEESNFRDCRTTLCPENSPQCDGIQSRRA